MSKEKELPKERKPDPDIKNILPPVIYTYYTMCTKQPVWEEKYINATPPIVPNISKFMIMGVLEPEWRELERFMAFIEREIILPYTYKHKVHIETGFKLSVMSLWQKKNPLDTTFLYNREVLETLKALLESHVFRFTNIPSSYRAFILNEKWEILLSTKVSNQNVAILSKDDIKKTLNLYSATEPDPFEKILQERGINSIITMPETSSKLN